MAPNDDAMLIGGGLILLAILAMGGGGGDTEKTTEFVFIPPDPPERPPRPMELSPRDDPPPKEFNEQPKKKSPQHPAFGGQQAQLREMSQIADNLYSGYQSLERRIREVWLRITGDEKKHRILYPATTEAIHELLHDMMAWVERTQAFAQRFSVPVQAVPRIGQALEQAVDNVRNIYDKLNRLLAESSKNRDNKFLTVDDLEALQ